MGLSSMDGLVVDGLLSWPVGTAASSRHTCRPLPDIAPGPPACIALYRLFCTARLQRGILEKYGVELIGAKLESINKAEDRELFANVSGRCGGYGVR